MTTHVVNDKAQAHREWSERERALVEVPGRPEYYGLVPLTLIGDAATLPFQALYFIFASKGDVSMSVPYVPIPIVIPGAK